MKYIGVTVLLAIVLIIAVAYGCCDTAEMFQNEATPMKKSLAAEMEEAVKQNVEDKETKEEKTTLSDMKEILKESDADIDKKNEANREQAKKKIKEEITLNKQEQELFDQITKNSIPSADLEKLVRAGVLTENMVEKFLNQIDKLSEEKIEGFCSGQDCYASVF